MKLVKIYTAILLLLPAAGLRAQDNLKQSVIKIFTVANTYDYDNPWQMRGQSKGTGSGCVIPGNRILTSAHVVSDSTFIQVKKAGDSKKYIARVSAISHESDLAIITVDESEFFNKVKPISIGKLPDVRDKVAVYGFPTGGDELSITEGVVSRIEQRRYAHSNANLLTCQIDAAINPGNSGGPVILNEKIIGVAFQASRGGENLGYMVPAPIIMHFLNDISDGKYEGFPEIGIFFQKMESPDLRRKFGLKEPFSGVRVAALLQDSPARGSVKIDDIIMKIDGVDIANDGTAEFRPGERTSLDYVVQRKYINDILNLKILRNGKEIDVKMRLSVSMNSTRLVPFEMYDTPPTYYINGGLVFEPLTKNYLQEWGNQWFFSAPSKLMNYYINGVRTENRKEVVLLTKVLADEINLGYHDLDNLVIVKVNGRNISDMDSLVKAFTENTGDYHIIIDDINRKIVINKKKSEHFGERILKRYRISKDRSPNLVTK